MASEQATVSDLDLRAGDVVEVRSLEEILASLDDNGEFENLPFMPEMVKYCGQRLTVYKVAHKLCDTVSKSGMHRMKNAVHLTGARCDGSGHGGCQAACLMFWKTAWLKKPDAASGTELLAAPASAPTPPLLAAASRRQPDDDGAERYRCQATEQLRAAPEQLPKRAVRQYVDDIRSGNASVAWVVRCFLVAVWDDLRARIAHVLPKRMAFIGRQFGAVQGNAVQTPTGSLDLQPGELVRIKSREEIRRTLNERSLNRGLGFDPEMARFCGREARVARHIDHIIDETSGRMRTMKQPCVVLENVVCEGAYNANCPRAITPYWREIWLERVDDASPSATATAEALGIIPRDYCCQGTRLRS